MRKEVVIAILIGLSLGLVIVFGIKTARQSISSIPKVGNQSKKGILNQNLQNQSNHTLLITSPEPNEIVSETQLAIIGSTSPQSYISAVSNDDETTTIADENGNFNATLTLIGGINTIIVTSFDAQGTSTEAIFSVIYSTADLNATTAAVLQKELK